MNGREWRALAASLSVHGAVLLGVALSPPWEVEADGEGRGQWSRPVEIAGYESGADADPGRAPTTSTPAPTPTLAPARSEEAQPQEILLPPVKTEARAEPRAQRPEAVGSAPNEPSGSGGEAGQSPSDAADTVSGEAPGGGVDRPPRFLGFSLPEDKEGAREVQVRILVGPDGQVQQVEGADSPLDPDLHREIRHAADSMRFLPALKDGRPVAAWLRMGFVL